MMRRIYGSQPNTESHHSQEDNPEARGFESDGIYQRHEGICRMERGECGKDIGIARIEEMEDIQSGHLVKSSETCHLPRRAGNRLHAMHRHIPWRRCRVNIIEGKTDQIHQ